MNGRWGGKCDGRFLLGVMASEQTYSGSRTVVLHGQFGVGVNTHEVWQTKKPPEGGFK